MPTGWLQEENNLKAVVAAPRTTFDESPYVGREYGVARYERIKGRGLRGGGQILLTTKDFWDAVRERWSGAFAQKGLITLKGPVDKLGLFKPLFDRADMLEEKPRKLNKEDQRVITEALKGMGVESGG